MKNRNVSLASLAIILTGMLFFSTLAQAAEVTRINQNKGLIVIDGKKSDGFVLGAAVCFYSPEGEKIMCGRVQQTSESYATVKVDNREAKQISYGMTAKLSDHTTACIDDSECAHGAACVNGKCVESPVKKSCVDDSECGDSGVCINGKCVSR